MDFIGGQYYKLNRILLQCLGLWPYRESFFKKIQIIFVEILFLSFLVCQLNTFFGNKYHPDSVIKTFAFITYNCIYILKYNAWFLLVDNIKYIFDRIRYDWNTLKNQAELEIIQEYAGNARLYTILFISVTFVVLVGFPLTYCVPCILDVIAPLNESRSRQLPVAVEYFIHDNEMYFYAILLHTVATNYIGCITIIAIATILIAYVLHTSALFKIASHRIEHIFDENILRIPKNIRQYILYEKLMHAMYVHRRALDLVNIMTNSFAVFYFVLLGFGILSTSFSLLQLFHLVISMDNNTEMINFGLIAFVHLYYIFVANYVGQNIIDTSVDVFYATYTTQWYLAPLWIQKLILFIMMKSNKRSTLQTGGLFDASLEGFTTIMSMSISYVMVFHSTTTEFKI